MNRTDRVHKTNIERLKEEFGENREKEIYRIYNRIRASEERTARIDDFVPIFVYRQVRQSLMNRS